MGRWEREEGWWEGEGRRVGRWEMGGRWVGGREERGG